MNQIPDAGLPERRQRDWRLSPEAGRRSRDELQIAEARLNRLEARLANITDPDSLGPAPDFEWLGDD